MLSGIYQYVIDFAGCGATVPLLGFGANLAKGAITEAQNSGLIGAFIGGVKASAGGIAAAIFFGYLASLIAKPKINVIISTYYKGTALEGVLKKLEEYLDKADKSENKISQL